MRALLAGAALCWPAAAALQTAQTPPPVQGGTVVVTAPRPDGPVDNEERGLWMQADEAERRLKASNFLITDPALNAYVRGVLCREVGERACGEARIYLTRTPYFNASMMPNGVMQIWSGLLLRVRDEAQLAAVLGHEFVHYRERHGLKQFREIKGKTNAIAFLSVLPFGGLVGAGLGVAQLGMIGSIFGFSRDQEREADEGSVRMLAESGYDPLAASRIWDQVRLEQEATAAARNTKARGNGGVFATHPAPADRMAVLRALGSALARPTATDLGAARYRAALAPFWTDFIDDQVKLNDFGGTELLLSQLAGEHWTGDLLYARAENHRARGAEGDVAAAAKFYADAIAAGGAPPEARRGLGLCLLRLGKAEEGRAALRDYLAAKPDAKDKAMMTMMAGA
jgi:hypothetical protein